MKLGKLNAAIRGLKTAPKISPKFRPDDLPKDEPISLDDLEITKQSLLNALKKAFPDAPKSRETLLCITEDGYLKTDDGDSDDTAEESAAEPEADDLEDLLG